MVVLNKIYTRTGDAGDTGLATGERLAKHADRVAAYGEVDETNACVGLVRLHTTGDAALDGPLARIQNELFDLGADLATPDRPGKPLGWEALRVTAAQVARLEADIDALNAELSPLTSFVLPAGSAKAAHLHLARTVCRRAERAATRLASAAAEPVNPDAVRYLNRLSDLLFVMARYANAKGRDDVLWVPGATRDGGASPGTA